MTVRYDDKGKYFTDIITKDRVPSKIQTLVNQIHGNLHVKIDERVKDELNRNEQFLAITSANVYDLQGKKIYDAEFMLINRDHVIWVVPDEGNVQTIENREDEA